MTVTETETGHYSPLKTNKVEIIQNEYYFTNSVTKYNRNRQTKLLRKKKKKPRKGRRRTDSALFFSSWKKISLKMCSL